MTDRPITHRLPDFIIAGAPRCATTWLAEALDRHASLAMAKPLRPEPKFFLVDDIYAKGLQYYSTTWFDKLPAGRVLGEKSANYLESATTAARIYHALPFVRLIFLLRNPVDRAYSNYLWTRRNGFETESFERALVLEAEREAKLPPKFRFARPFSYVTRGLYAEHLARFLLLFPRDRITVIKTEDLAMQPAVVLCGLHRFLGVPERLDTIVSLAPVNSAVEPDSEPLPASLRAALVERFREPNHALGRLLGPAFTPWFDC